MLLVALLVACISCACGSAMSRDYRFDGSMSEEVLRSYLSRSMTLMYLLLGQGNLDDNIRMMTNCGVKFAERTVYDWGREQGGEPALPQKLARARVDAAKVHAADPEIILQAWVWEMTFRAIGSPFSGMAATTDFVTVFEESQPMNRAMPMKYYKNSAAPTRLQKLPAAAIITTGIVVLTVVCQAANPFITSIYTADPSAHVWADGRLYVYPSHDMDPARGCDLMDRYHVFSTEDMVNWSDEGEILRASQVPWGRPQGGFMWAPDCAYRNGTYYFYFPHPSDKRWNDSWKIGVATSTKPASDFKDAGYITGLGGFAMIDPAVFMDDDGQAYMYFGGGGHCQGGKLKANMVELDGALEDMTGLVDFHEATWVFKRNGIYYLSYADNYPGSNRMRYATSSKPLGPWTHRGIYMEPTGCDTTHGSVVEYKGQWYQFYHNQSISGHGNLRSMCVDRLYFNPDGTIKTLVQTKEGVPAVGPAPAPVPDTKYAAESAAVGNGAQVEDDAAAAGGKSVRELHLENSYLQFNQVGGGDGGRNTITIHYATADKAKLRLFVNGIDWSFLNTPATGGWDTYIGRAFFTVPLGPGSTNVIRLVGGHGGVNVDYITVSPLP